MLGQSSVTEIERKRDRKAYKMRITLYALEFTHLRTKDEEINANFASISEDLWCLFGKLNVCRLNQMIFYLSCDDYCYCLNTYNIGKCK